MEVSFIADNGTKDHFWFSVLSVVCDPEQATKRLSFPSKEKKPVPPFLEWLLTINEYKDTKL